jgi:hypothetical protein
MTQPWEDFAQVEESKPWEDFAGSKADESPSLMEDLIKPMASQLFVYLQQLLVDLVLQWLEE